MCDLKSDIRAYDPPVPEQPPPKRFPDRDEDRSRRAEADPARGSAEAEGDA
jgi:hypothetical protein